MGIVYLLIPLGLVLVGIGLWAFFWAVGDGQFDDLDSPGWSVLKDDEPGAPPRPPGHGEMPR
ncbi:MAG TPA: cbb3-type cytochrome oxidase assembly protein CcoS [Steroidobacteraceae bacterium]|nr:cbb3-type cytochrome oxidase assembly protein CcoS [Steroidobacteraceae bacterium]